MEIHEARNLVVTIARKWITAKVAAPRDSG